MNDKTVLIVEDDEWLAEQYLRVIKKHEYTAVVASNALAAIQMVDDVHPHAIVLDVLLTGSTAFTLLHELQSYSDTGKIPIILCTNLAKDLSVEDLRPYGVKLVIDKTSMIPSDIPDALKAIFA